MPPSTSPAAAGRALAEDSEQPQQCCQTTKVSNVQITPVSPDTMKKKHISRKMYFKEITPKQGSSSSAHGCAQVLLLPRNSAGLAGGASPCPKSGSLNPGLHQCSLCRTKDAGNEALQGGDFSLYGAIIW